MVQISIQPIKNINHGGRFYPYSGYLGLTKLVIEGVVRTRIEDDHKLLPAHSVTVSVKCYEARTKLTYSRVNTLADDTHVLWSSPTDAPTNIGDMDLPFRIVLPPSIAGYSTLSFPEYKVFWRLEAAINHPRQFGLGNCQTRVYDLALTRYDIPKPLPPISPSYNALPASSRHPAFSYRIKPLEHAVGPGESLPVVVSFQLQDNHRDFLPHSLSIALLRQLDLFQASASPTSGTTDAAEKPFSTYNHPDSTLMSSLTRVAASRSTPYLPSYQLSRKRSTSPPPQVVLPSKSVTSLVATAQSSEFYYDSKSNRIETHFALSLPAKASPNQWPIGESLRTALATLRFELHAKLCVSAGAGPVEISLQPLEVQLSPVSQEQRSVVVGKVARKRAARSKSAAGSRKVSPTPSTSGSSKGDPETPPPVPTPPSSVELSPPESAAYTFTRHTGPTADDVHQSRGRSSSKRRTRLVDMPQSSRKSIQPAAVGQAVAFTSDDVAFGAALSGSLKRMPSHAVRDWEAELERITSSSKLKTDAMRGKSATDHGHGDNSRASRALRMRRCTIATQPPPVGTFQTSYPPKVSVAQ